MFRNYLNSFNEVLAKSSANRSNGSELDLDDCFREVHDLLTRTKQAGKRVYLVGNGGSSAIVSHGAIDFLNACGFKAHALTDNSMLTCLANDYGYENVFSQALNTLLDPEDVLIAISSSGNSQNILNACEAARNKKAHVIAFSGFQSDNKLRNLGDYNFWLNDNHYGRVEIGHSLLLHYITDQLVSK